MINCHMYIYIYTYNGIIIFRVMDRPSNANNFIFFVCSKTKECKFAVFFLLFEQYLALVSLFVVLCTVSDVAQLVEWEISLQWTCVHISCIMFLQSPLCFLMAL